MWFTITLFHLADTIGRFFASPLLNCSKRTIYIIVYTRIIFFITSYVLTLQIEPASVFQADWARILNTFLFAFSQGFASIVLVFVPMSCSERQKGKGGELGGVSLLFGVAIGCLLASFLMTQIVPKNYEKL